MGKGWKQTGYVIVSVAMSLVVLCGFAALAVDIGLFLSARAAAQRAADAGALGGAFTFVSQPFAAQPATAQQHALATTLTNTILDSSIAPADVSVVVDVANRRVTVDLTHTRQAFFARALGQNQANIAVRGIAEASFNATGSACTKPWFIPNTVVSPQTPCNACAAGEYFIDAAGNVTAFAMSQLGMQFTIKPNNPQQALAPGQFFAIRMPDSQGGNDYRTNIATCSPDYVYCEEAYGVEPGNMIGPTLQGVRDLIGAYPDIYLSIGQYQHADATISDTSHHLIIAPIWDECNLAGFCPGEVLPDQGANLTINVIGYALIFLEGVQGNNVMARLIWVSSCGGGGGPVGPPGLPGPAPPEVGPLSIPVRLVRTP